LIAFIGGLQKAIWKLNMALTQVSINPLSDYLFVYQAIGFGLMAIAVGSILSTLNHPTKTPIPLATILMLYMTVWKISSLSLTIVFAGITYFILARLAFTHKCRGGGLFFISTFFMFLAMGGIAAGNLSIIMQWVAEVINIVAQILFLLGTYQFNKYGCKD
jgi:hypothetical protein